AGSIQVCTAAMHYGFKIVEDMISGLSNWMDSKGYRTLDDFRGLAVPNYVDWGQLDMNYVVKARIDQDKCIQCGLCHIACEDTSHQSIRAIKENGSRRYEVIEEECVGCNLCAHVCPVEGCISMVEIPTGLPYVTWAEDPRNPQRIAKAAE
ncbi:MAG: 4Fe-4S binding protein, partial [Geminicoccaceae bacterium]|nr:4Fe-4S binding protein [Geminicoccaceae bacterium]